MIQLYDRTLKKVISESSAQMFDPITHPEEARENYSPIQDWLRDLGYTWQGGKILALPNFGPTDLVLRKKRVAARRPRIRKILTKAA